MDTPSSEVSLDSSTSATANPTPADSSPAQNLPEKTQRSQNSNMSSPALSTDDSDSDSDVSMSAGTDDEDDDQSLTPLTNRNSEQSKVLGKRKLSSESPSSQMETDISNEARKRLKSAGSIVPYRTAEGRLLLDKSLLPAEIWHRVFTFCHPRVLGLLLQVNKSFNAYIDPSSTAHPSVRSPEYVLQLLQPDAIWRASRLLFRNGMPGPLAGRSEMEMWKLACSSRCQFCGKQDNPGPADQWHPGPGINGVSRVWSFGICSCGSCLEKNTAKVTDFSREVGKCCYGLTFV
jgi:hypothetical protein